MINGSIELSHNEKLSFLICDGIRSISKSVNLWYEVTDNGCRIQYSYQQHSDFENSWSYILEAIEKYRQGLIQCSYCGKWIPINEAHHTSPAGCSCNDCYDKALSEEREFFSFPLD